MMYPPHLVSELTTANTLPTTSRDAYTLSFVTHHCVHLSGLWVNDAVRVGGDGPEQEPCIVRRQPQACKQLAPFSQTIRKQTRNRPQRSFPCCCIFGVLLVVEFVVLFVINSKKKK